MTQEFNRISKVSGELKLPGDKSISHRAVIFSSLAKGKSKITNLLESEDIFSTINCFKALGCKMEREGNSYVVEGGGINGFSKPGKALDAGNSGTTARLISGILSAQDFESVLVGDESLTKRPMRRVVDPLRLMGAEIELSENGTLPLTFHPSNQLQHISYELEVASAQVKSALILAAIHLDEETNIIEPKITRDHTERMLGCRYEIVNGIKKIIISKSSYPEPKEYVVPSDISTASFFIVLTLLLKDSQLLIKDVSLNQTRTGVITVLKSMGARINIDNERESSGEPIADITISSSDLENISIPESMIPNIIDEIPILSVAGLFAEGSFEIRNAGELRVKESDRISSLCENYKKLGVNVEEFNDGFSLSGEIKNVDIEFDSFGDHRIAMTFAILSLLKLENAAVKNFECVNISNPGFLRQLKLIKTI